MADGGVQHKLVEILCANVTEIYEGGMRPGQRLPFKSSTSSITVAR